MATFDFLLSRPIYYFSKSFNQALPVNKTPGGIFSLSTCVQSTLLMWKTYTSYHRDIHKTNELINVTILCTLSIKSKVLFYLCFLFDAHDQDESGPVKVVI